MFSLKAEVKIVIRIVISQRQTVWQLLQFFWDGL